jgi:hypothetical protein
VVAGWATSYGGGFANLVVTASGDVYQTGSLGQGPWVMVANVFSGATPAEQTTFGGLKARYR